jgi:site-specific DNA-cytosine methylase
MRVLVACEESQTVCKEFRRLGHEAYSCDVQECSGGHPEWHLQYDVFDVINDGWDMMLAFPPCTFLTYAGMANWYDEGRALSRIKAAEFFMRLYESPIKYVAVENPQGIMAKIFREPDQIIHPYYFGDREMKRTCLWLKNLPLLKYELEDTLFGEKTAVEKPKPSFLGVHKRTGKVKPRYYTDSYDKRYRFKSPQEKSKTFPGIARAMAEQFSEFYREVAV